MSRPKINSTKSFIKLNNHYSRFINYKHFPGQIWQIFCYNSYLKKQISESIYHFNRKSWVKHFSTLHVPLFIFHIEKVTHIFETIKLELSFLTRLCCLSEPFKNKWLNRIWKLQREYKIQNYSDQISIYLQFIYPICSLFLW